MLLSGLLWGNRGEQCIKGKVHSHKWLPNMSAVPQHIRQGAVDPPLSKAAILLTTLQTWPAQWYRLKVVKTLRKTHLRVCLRCNGGDKWLLLRKLSTPPRLHVSQTLRAESSGTCRDLKLSIGIWSKCALKFQIHRRGNRRKRCYSDME